jgi:hypothetical protein
MLVPEDAMAEDTTTTEDLNKIKNELASKQNNLMLLSMTGRDYQLDEPHCSEAVDVLASILLPAIFNHSQDALCKGYKDTINRNPWLIKMLFDAHKSETYDRIRQLGLCSSQIVCLPRLIFLLILVILRSLLKEGVRVAIPPQAADPATQEGKEGEPQTTARCRRF